MAQSKIFIPGLSDYKCIFIRSGDVIRAYKQVPNYNTNVQYDDIYPNANYVLVSGVQQFGNQGYTSLPSCVSSQYLTDDFYYRNDFDKILTIFIIIVIFAIWFPFKLFSRFCKRLWR